MTEYEHKTIRRRRVLRWLLSRLNERLAEARRARDRNAPQAERDMIARAEELSEMARAFADEVQP